MEPEIFYCQNPSCLKAFCYTCIDEVPHFQNLQDYEDFCTNNSEESEEEWDKDYSEKHF